MVSLSSSSHNRKPVKVSVPLILALGVGFGLGVLVTLAGTPSHPQEVQIFAATAAGQPQYPNPTVSRVLPAEDASSSSSGWHPIHVFYGNAAALLEPTATQSQALSSPSPSPQWFAQVHQDQVIVDLLGPNGYFIDLAANDAKEWSNTLALEQYHGWTGLCVEPNPQYWYGLSHRKCTVVGALVGSTVERVEVKFRGVFGGIVGRMDESLAKRKREPDAAVEQRYTAPLQQVFDKFRVPKTIDYLSLDVEGAEMLIMKDFPFDTYRIKVMTIERPTKPLQKLLESKDYIHLKDFAWWGETLWAHKSTGLTPEHPNIKKIPFEGK